MKMDQAGTSDQREGTDPVPFRIDEVANTTADIPNNASTEDNSKLNEGDEAVPARLARAMEDRDQSAAPSTIRIPTRPQLLRGGSAPPPPQQPPPPAPPQQQSDEIGNGTDSLSLIQLKRLVNDMPRVEPTAYAFEYNDTQGFPEELDEWFQYTDEDKTMVLQGRATFETKWEESLTEGAPAEETLTWTQASDDQRRSFIKEQISGLEDVHLSTRVSCLEAMTYIALGAWGDTAGLREDGRSGEETEKATEGESRYDLFGLQMQWSRRGAEIFLACSALQPIFNAFRRICDQEQLVGSRFPQPHCPNATADIVGRAANLILLTRTRRWAKMRRHSSGCLDRRRSTTLSP